MDGHGACGDHGGGIPDCHSHTGAVGTSDIPGADYAGTGASGVWGPTNVPYQDLTKTTQIKGDLTPFGPSPAPVRMRRPPKQV